MYSRVGALAVGTATSQGATSFFSAWSTKLPVHHRSHARWTGICEHSTYLKMWRVVHGNSWNCVNESAQAKGDGNPKGCTRQVRSSVFLLVALLNRRFVSYCTLQAAFKTMKTEHNLSQELLTTAMKEIKALRHSVADGLAGNWPIKSIGAYLQFDSHPTLDKWRRLIYACYTNKNGRARTSRRNIWLYEAHHFKFSSYWSICFEIAQRVTDLLRDKLHHLSAQLADSQTKVRELEEEKRSVWCKALNDCQIQASKSQVLLILGKFFNNFSTLSDLQVMFRGQSERFSSPFIQTWDRNIRRPVRCSLFKNSSWHCPAKVTWSPGF